MALTASADSFKIQSYPMYYDTSHNSAGTVLRSLYGAFCEAARKMLAYIRCLARPQQPSTSLITRKEGVCSRPFVLV